MNKLITDVRLSVDVVAYHNDALTEHPALSQSLALVLLQQCEKHAWAKHPKFGNHKREPSDSMTVGTIVDEVLIGKGSRCDVLEFKDFRTKDAQEARDASAAAGRIPVIASKMEGYRECAGIVAAAIKRDHGIDLDGADCLKQICVLWSTRASNGNAVQCKGLVDFAFWGASQLWDLKTGDSIHPRGLDAKSHAFGYAIQAAAYLDALAKIDPDTEGRAAFRNLWVEPVFPYLSVVSKPGGAVLHYGRIMWQRAVDIFEQCVRTNVWPSYTKPGEVVTIKLHPRAREELVLLGLDDGTFDEGGL